MDVGTDFRALAESLEVALYAAAAVACGLTAVGLASWLRSTTATTVTTVPHS